MSRFQVIELLLSRSNNKTLCCTLFATVEMKSSLHSGMAFTRTCKKRVVAKLRGRWHAARQVALHQEKNIYSIVAVSERRDLVREAAEFPQKNRSLAASAATRAVCEACCLLRH